MPVIHAIRINEKGKIKTIRLTPIKAIRLNCIECMGYQSALIKDCTSNMCPLYPYRMGKYTQRVV